MDAKKTGELISTLRRERNLNQIELAELLGVTNKAISRWETGRGYPDIETLPMLSEVLNVSIPELLSGERIQSSSPERYLQSDQQVCVDQSIDAVCQIAGEQTRKQKKKFTLWSVLLAIVVILFSTVGFLMRILPTVLDFFYYAEDFRWSVSGLYWSVVGSEDCVVAHDYMSLTYMGKTYLPLHLNGYEAVLGEKMVKECQVEGTGFLGKLFFGESLYELKNVPNQELVYLQTDYDHCISEYFVLDTEYDRYAQMVQDADLRYYYAVFDNESLYSWDYPLSEEMSAWLNAPDSKPITSKPEHTGIVGISVFDEDHIFYKQAGWIYRMSDGYYWAPEENAFYDNDEFFEGTDVYFPVGRRQYYPIGGFEQELGKLLLN